jgi:hypothetical protein
MLKRRITRLDGRGSGFPDRSNRLQKTNPAVSGGVEEIYWMGKA